MDHGRAQQCERAVGAAMQRVESEGPLQKLAPRAANAIRNGLRQRDEANAFGFEGLLQLPLSKNAGPVSLL